MPPLKPLPNFKYQRLFSYCSPSNVNVHSSNDPLGDGLFTLAPPTKFVNMPFGEQLLQVFDIMHKSKCPSHFKKEFLSASSYNTITIHFSLIIDITQILLTNCFWKEWEFNWVFQDVWAIKVPWAKAIIGPKVLMTQVRCRICSEVEKRYKLLVPKFDGLQKCRSLESNNHTFGGGFWSTLNKQHKLACQE
jgi:hypothetical protein